MKKMSLLFVLLYNYFSVTFVSAQPALNKANLIGYFDGRTPCQELAKQLNELTIPECIKIKWRLILFHDSLTNAPTTYILEGFVYRNPPKTGTWAISRGSKADANAIVFELDPDKTDPDHAFMFLLKADDNVLFIMDKDRKLMVGNDNFSYTLYRTVN